MNLLSRSWSLNRHLNSAYVRHCVPSLTNWLENKTCVLNAELFGSLRLGAFHPSPSSGARSLLYHHGCKATENWWKWKRKWMFYVCVGSVWRVGEQPHGTCVGEENQACREQQAMRPPPPVRSVTRSPSECLSASKWRSKDLEKGSSWTLWVLKS